MKKILITTESLQTGGVETTLLALLKFLNNYNVQIDLYVLEEGALLKEFKKLNNVKLIPIKLPKNKKVYRVLKNLLCKKIYNRYKKQNIGEYDISIAFYGINNYCDMYAASANAKEKFIWVHNNFESLYKLSNHKILVKIRNKLIYKKFKYFDHIIPVSESAKKGFSNTFKGYEDRVTVINNILDTSRIEKKDEKCEYIMDADNKLLYVGRLVNTKCVDLLINEYQKVIKKIPNSKLYIVGDGPERQKLENIVKEIQMTKNIIFLGNQSNPFKYINQADIITTASSSETYPIVLLEALAMKKYFVSANNEGAQDIFETTNKFNTNNGIICKQDDMHKHIIFYLKNKKTIKPNFNMIEANKEIEKKLLDILNISN